MTDKYLVNVLKTLSENLYKIIEVNLDEDTYFEIKNDTTTGPTYTSVMKWVDAFIEEGVYPADRDRFYAFFNPFRLKQHTDEWQRVYYRRKIDGKWRYVCMEVIPTPDYSEDNPIVIIVVRDVEDYIYDYRRQVKGDLI